MSSTRQLTRGCFGAALRPQRVCLARLVGLAGRRRTSLVSGWTAQRAVLLPQPVVGISPGRRGFSYSSAGDAAPACKVWSFDEVVRVLGQEGGPLREVVIVDVRGPDELESTGKIPGAVNIPVTSAMEAFHAEESEFRESHGFERPSRSSALLFYCKAGVRARTAAEMAKRAGWETVGVYPGSWLEWEAKGGPVERLGAAARRRIGRELTG